MESLEELKAIIDNAPEGASHIAKSAGQSRYLKHNKRRDFIYYDGKTFCAFPTGSGYLKTCKSIRSISDIKRIIELMERAAKDEPVKAECGHDDCITHWDHHQCKSCGYVLTDGGFGCASRKWFTNIEAAKFYQKNGFLPG